MVHDLEVLAAVILQNLFIGRYVSHRTHYAHLYEIENSKFIGVHFSLPIKQQPPSLISAVKMSPKMILLTRLRCCH